MSPRLRRILNLAGYPAFYVLCFFVFAYFTFPYERLKERLVSEFDKQQRASGGTQRLEIESLGPYWFTGIAAKGVKLSSPTVPTPDNDHPLPNELLIDSGHARLSFWPLLIGRTQVTFGLNAYEGSISGSSRVGGENGAFAVDVDSVQLGRATVVASALGLPVAGSLTGHVEIDLPEQKLSKASGAVELSVTDLTAGDGKAKIQGKLALPKLNVGKLEIVAEAKEGILRVNKLGAAGQDIDVAAEGKISLRDTLGDSLADLAVRFKFSDAYKGRNDVTKSLFGTPGSSMPALFELADARIKMAKRGDGFYAWHMGGALRDPRFDPAAGSGSAPKGALR